LSGEIAELESRVVSHFAEVDGWLKGVGVDAARRPLRARVEDLQYRWLEAQTLELDFFLRSGSFATALLRELITFDDVLPEGAE
jgi:tRNA pseudouridine13 synthase